MAVMESELFTVALGLQPPWEVVGVRFDPEVGQIDLEVEQAPWGRAKEE